MNGQFSLAILLAVISIGACGVTKDYEPTGTWIGQSSTDQGGAHELNETWTFHDGTFTVDDGVAKYAYQVDAAREPKQIDLWRGSASADSQSLMGIYKIENDTLTIAHLIRNRAKAGAKRPENFSVAERSDVVVHTFQRKK